MGIVTIGEGHYKIMCLSKLTYSLKLLVGGVFITPTEIFLDCTGEENVLLKHNTYLVTKGFDIIGTYILSAYQNATLVYIVKTGDKGDKRGLGAACTSDNTDGLT
jgi:hypothetical protein